MVTLTWIDVQIEKAIEEGNNPQNIRDLAALITVREYLATRSARKQMHRACRNLSMTRSAGMRLSS